MDSDGTQQTPKRKSVNKTKQAAAVRNNHSTAISPTSKPTSNIDTLIQKSIRTSVNYCNIYIYIYIYMVIFYQNTMQKITEYVKQLVIIV